MSMPKGKQQGGQTQGYSQHYQRPTSFVSRSTTPQQRPDVSFHVATAAFPPQQGGGAAPPGGPQLRGLHHSHHGGNPPIPPAHQQQPPPPNQSQHPGGPPGPAPTSTPPGPAEMGKQGPPHLQGQPQGIPQGGQMQLSFGVPNQTRPNQSQPYFTAPRGPTPRMPNHRGQVVNMPTNNVGQQIFSSHVPTIQQMQMYPVAPINPSTMFVPASQMQMFSTGSRHQATGTNYFAPPTSGQQLMMHQHQLQYPGFQPSQAQFFYSGVRSQSMAAAPGGVGSGLTGSASQPVVVPGGPPQMSQTGQVSMMPLPGSSVMGMPGLAGDSGTPSGPVSSSSSSGSKHTRRKHALDIVDPKTMKNIDVYESSGSSTPPRSGDSSARETPQPGSGSGQMDVAAEFAARVAKAASENSSGPPVSQVPFSEPSVSAPQQIINVNGPDPICLKSIAPSSDSVLNQSDTSLSKPQIVVLDDQITSSWKQTPPKASSIGNKISSNSKSSKNEASLGKMEEQGTLSLESDSLVKQEIGDRSVPLGVPSVSVKDVTVSQSDLPLVTPHLGQPVIPMGVVPVKDHSPSGLPDPNLTPVVSAITNSPDVELVHLRSSNREQYPGLKSSMPAHSSPRRKARTQEVIPVEKVTSSQSLPTISNTPSVTATVTQVSSSSGMILPPSVDAKPIREFTPASATMIVESKVSQPLPSAKKTSSVAEQPSPVVVEEPMFITPAPKERREEKASRGRDRSSQGKEAPEKPREKSQGRDRDKTASRVRDNITPVPSLVSGSPPVSSAEPSPIARVALKTQTPASPLEEIVTKHQTNGETTEIIEGKASQQRSKHNRSKQKKELNRKGAEKEGTEMDAFAEPAAPIPAIAETTSASVSTPVVATTIPLAPAAAPTPAPQVPSPVSSPIVDPVSIASSIPATVTTLVTTPVTQQVVSQIVTASSVVASASSISVTSSTITTTSIPANNPISAAPVIPTNSVLPNTNKMADSIELKNEDVDDVEKEDEENLVAARNQENAKVSAVNSEKPPLIEQTAPSKAPSVSKISYKEDQWSPNNQDGKKKYERDFLMSLKNEPLSKMKPSILPDLEIVLKDPRPARSMDIMRGGSHDAFTPKFMNQGPSSRGGVPPKRGSQQGKAKGGKPQGVIHVTLSLREEVKLRETENAWKPGRMKPSEIAETDAKTEELYKKVRGVLNKLTPQKFSTLVEQVKSLPIDTKDKLQGVINLVFDKAIDEPGFSVAYAQMCKVLSNIQVTADKEETVKEEAQAVNFRKLIVTRCQQEFEKNSEAELNKEQRLKEISNTKDPEKRKELQLQFDEESRKLRMKSVGNIRFIGELFKLQMLTTTIMHRCIRQLLSDGDEESLECLCKLLTTIGHDLETKKQDLGSYFDKMKQISHKRGEISSRVRFMLQDVIELRQHKWIPRRDDLNPKTIDQINKEAEKEAIEQAMNLGSSSGPRYKNEDRGSDRKKGRGPSEDGWYHTGRKNYSVDTTRLKPKVVESETISLGSRSLYTNWNSNSKAADTIKKNPSPVISNNSFAALSDMPSEEKRGSSFPSRSGGSKIAPSSSAEKERMLAGLKSATEGPQQSHMQQSRSSSRDNAPRGVDELHAGASHNIRLGPIVPSNEDALRSTSPETSVLLPDVPLMPDEAVKMKTLVLIDEYFRNSNEAETAQAIAETFGEANINAFVLECMNGVLEKSSGARQNVGKLMCHLVKEGVVPKPVFLTSFSQIVSDGDDLVIDIPKIWLYLAEIIVPLLSAEIVSFSEFRSIPRMVGQFVADVLQLLVKDKGPTWIKDRWDSAGLSWTEFDKIDNVDSFIKQHKLEFTVGVGGAGHASGGPLSMDKVQEKLVQFLKPEQSGAHSFDEICDWIDANVGSRVSEPQFIRALMTALCENAVSRSSATTIKFKKEVLDQHAKFFQKYIENKEEPELQCLYAIQSFVHRLEHPQGLICSIFQHLWDNNFVSNESFTTWESSKEPCEQVGKGVALKSLTTFFTALKEVEDDSEES